MRSHICLIALRAQNGHIKQTAESPCQTFRIPSPIWPFWAPRSGNSLACAALRSVSTRSQKISSLFAFCSSSCKQVSSRAWHWLLFGFGLRVLEHYQLCIVQSSTWVSCNPTLLSTLTLLLLLLWLQLLLTIKRVMMYTMIITNTFPTAPTLLSSPPPPQAASSVP